MAYNNYKGLVIQMGQESTAGTAVAADFIWVSEGGAAIQDERNRIFPEYQAGAVVPTLDFYDGMEGALLNLPETALIAVEQTANLGGGAIWPLEALGAVAGS